MLLTIHNLPSSTRFADVKRLLQEKCGLTEVIVDNLMSEGTGKKVTVGLANEDDGAFVVRKLNGLFINGQQLYIEDKRRTTADQPYRPSCFEPAVSNNIQPAVGAAPAWNQTTPYIQPAHVDNNLAYMVYGAVPQVLQYVQPNQVSAEIPGYSGYQVEAYAPNKQPRNHESGDWGRNSRDQPPDAFRSKDGKRRHSPERPTVSSKRASRLDNFNKEKSRREPSPSHQWAEENRSFQQQFSRQNQNIETAYQPRQPNPDYRQSDRSWEQPRWEDPKPRPEREQQWGNDNQGWEPQTDKAWEQWDSQPKPHWESPPKPQWENPQQPQWEQPKPQWEPPKPQWDQPEPQWNNQSKPQWENSIPVQNIRSEMFDNPPRGNDREFQPRGHDRYNDSRSQNKGFNESIRDPIRGKKPENSFGSSGMPSSKDRRQRNDWRDTRPIASGGRQKPDFGKPKEYPTREFKRQAKPERYLPKVSTPETPRHEREEPYRQNTYKGGFVKEKKTYPPVFQRPVRTSAELRFENNKPQSLRAMINKDVTNRGQATARLAKQTLGLAPSKPYHPSPLDTFIFKQLKVCIRSRIDVLFGEELSVHEEDVIIRYRSKYPTNEDKTLVNQVREKSTREFEEKEKAVGDEADNDVSVKKEKEAIKTANGEKENKTTAGLPTNDKDQTASAKKAAFPLPPNLPKAKRGAPLTDKQVIQQQKILRKWEYDQDDLYSLDDDKTKALDEEMAALDKLFIEECSQPADQHETLICKRITTDSLNVFNKTIQLYISKRFLNIPTGLAVRMLSTGIKAPKKTAVLEYLKKLRIKASAVKKSVKGGMVMINLNRFEDYDTLCNMENDVIDGFPVTFKAFHLIGPPPKMSKNQVKAMREKMINDQVEGLDLGELEDVDFGDIGDTKISEGDNVEKSDEGADIEKLDEGGDMEKSNDVEKLEEGGDMDKLNDGGDIEKLNEGGYLEKSDEGEDTEKLNADDAGPEEATENVAEDEFAGAEDFPKDVEETGDSTEDFAEEINIENINEDDLEDF